MKNLLFCSLMFAAAGGAYGSTITWANNMAPSSTGVYDLGGVSGSILDDTNTNTMFVNSLNITDLPSTASIGDTVNPLYTGSVHLSYKNDGPGEEHGLGVMALSDGEVRLSYTLQLNLSAYSFTTASITLDSIDPGEGFRIWGSTTANGQMKLLAADTSANGFVQTETLGNTYKFFEITSDTPSDSTSSVIVRSVILNTSTVPEPGTMAMLGSGLLGLGWVRLKARKR